MANSADPDQLATEANWSESTLFAKAGHIWVQQDYSLGKIQQTAHWYFLFLPEENGLNFHLYETLSLIFRCYYCLFLPIMLNVKSSPNQQTLCHAMAP